MEARESIYVGGSWVQPGGEGAIAVVDAATEEIIGSVPVGTIDDVDRAVQAAAKAFPAWATTPLEERAKLIQRVAEALTDRKDEIAATVTREVGTTIEASERVQAGLAITDVASQATIAREFDWTEQIDNVVVVKSPIGVVGAITPWNYPLHQVCAKSRAGAHRGLHLVVVKPRWPRSADRVHPRRRLRGELACRRGLGNT